MGNAANRSLFTKSRHLFEYVALLALAFCFNAMPHGLAARIAGSIAYGIGRFTRGQTAALNNLNHVYPAMSISDKKRLARNIWYHLGAVFADFCRMGRISNRLDHFITLDGKAVIERAKQHNRPILLVAAHFGNWEVGCLLANITGIHPNFIYRSVNNPYIDRWVQQKRRCFAGELLPKGANTAKQLVRAFLKGKDSGFMFDLKFNAGKPISFFGAKCMTAITPLELGLKHHYQLVLCHCVRHDQGLWRDPKFTITLEAMNDPESAADHIQDDALALAIWAHQRLEAWIKQHPEQWLWLHRRWG